MSINDVSPNEWDEVSKKFKDNVNSPAHYNTGDVECIQAIQSALSPEEYRGYLRGNTLKYIWRCNYKGKKLEDLRKAQWYINRLSEVVESGK